MKKHKAPQVPLPLFGQAEEPFALIQETAQDGQRLAAEQARKEADRTHAGTLQRDIPGIKGTFHVHEDCLHPSGYWINEGRNFRCYTCQFQVWLEDMTAEMRKVKRKIEVWRNR